MRFLKRVSCFALAGCLVGLSLGTGSADQPAEKRVIPDTQQSLSWLVVLQGKVQSIDGDKMVLSPDTRGLAFTDRPFRTALTVDLPKFVAHAWGDDGSFAKDPPNASLINETRQNIGAVTILDAEWDGTRMAVRFNQLEGIAPKAGDQIGFTIDHITSPCNPMALECNWSGG